MKSFFRRYNRYFLKLYKNYKTRSRRVSLRNLLRSKLKYRYTRYTYKRKHKRNIFFFYKKVPRFSSSIIVRSVFSVRSRK